MKHVPVPSVEQVVEAAVTAIVVVAVTAVVAAVGDGANRAGNFLIFYINLLTKGAGASVCPLSRPYAPRVRTMEA